MGGIGFHSARWLAERGCHVVLAGRNAERLAACAKQIRDASKGPTGTPLAAEEVKLTELVLDLDSLASVEKFAADFQALNLPLNILLNNAGIMATPYLQTEDGFEKQMGTNHLGHFYLTKLLLPQLTAGAPSRVVNVASMGHRFANMQSDKLGVIFHPTASEYGRYTAYGNSKLANILFSRSLQAKHSANGVTAYSLHPGVVATDLGKQGWVTKVLYGVGAFAMKSAEEGAGTSIYCATSPAALLHAGAFFDRCDVSTNHTAKAVDDALAEALWVQSEEELTKWQNQRQPGGAAAAAAAGGEEQK